MPGYNYVRSYMLVSRGTIGKLPIARYTVILIIFNNLVLLLAY